MMNNRIRISAKLSAISCFAFKQGNPNPLIILSSSTFHTSTQNTLTLTDLNYAFKCINNIDEAVTLFHYMLQMKPKPSVWDYNRLFKAVMKMEHYSQVIVMFKKLGLLGSPVNEYTMNTLIICYSHLKEVELSFAIVAAFLKLGYAPNVVSFNCIIKGLFLKGKVGKVVALFNKLIKCELCEVNEFTISIVVDGLSKSGDIGNAVELLQMWEENDWKINVVAYSAVIDGLCKRGMVKEGMDLLFRMIDRDVLPNVVTYNIFLYGLCNHGKLDFARSVFDDLGSKGICPDVITYTVMIQGLCREGLFQDAKEMLDEMERVGCLPNSVTYNVIIQACLHHRSSFDSINLLKQIVGRDFQLDARSFFVLLKQMQELHQMQDIYDDNDDDDHDVINHFIWKLVSCGARLQMRDNDDEFMVIGWIQKIISGGSRCK